MMKVQLPQRFAALAYGVIQSAITTAVATTVAAFKGGPTGYAAITYWVSCWTVAWLAMLPIVILVSPVIQKVILRFMQPRF